MEADASKTTRQTQTWIAMGCLGAIALALVLMCTNHGVGLPPGSLGIVDAAKFRAVWKPAPLYSLILSALAAGKHDAAAASRIPQAILFAISVVIAALTVWRSGRDRSRSAVLVGFLLIAAPTVVHAFTLVRPESLLIASSLGTLAFAEEWGRSRRIAWCVPTMTMAAICALSGIGGPLVVIAAIVSVIAARHGKIVGAGHLWFAVFYAVTTYLIQPEPRHGWMYAPAISAAVIFVGSIAARSTITLLVITAACLSFTLPWVIRATREGHDFATVTWKHSLTMRSIAHLPRESIYYSNAPEAIALYDHHPVRAIPAAGDVAGWSKFNQVLTHEESFVVWFTVAGGDVDSLSAHVELEKYEATADGAIYRADASRWVGGTRRIAFNPNTPSIPARRSAGHFDWWNKKHAGYAEQAAKGGVDLLFLGDSITDDYRKIPGAWDFFEQRYGRYHPANFGIDGDRTQHLLWRIGAGECDHVTPRVAIILIGTNNTGEDSAEAIANGIRACVEATRQRLPGTRVLLLGLFPRGGSAENNDKRAIILKVNTLIAPLENGDTVRFLNLYDRFLEPDGTLSKDVMYDSLHPSLRGYHMWADAMQPLLDEMMRLPAVATPTTRSH